MSRTLIDPPIETLKALAHPLRFHILDVLRDGERNVGEIEAISGIGQPALSQQLGVLRKAGLVDTRKQAKLVYYRLGSEKLAVLAECIGQFIAIAEGSSGQISDALTRRREFRAAFTRSCHRRTPELEALENFFGR